MKSFNLFVGLWHGPQLDLQKGIVILLLFQKELHENIGASWIDMPIVLIGNIWLVLIVVELQLKSVHMNTGSSHRSKICPSYRKKLIWIEFW